MTGEILKRVLDGVRFNYTNEKELQGALEMVFKMENITYRREVEIAPGCRIDFLLGKSVGVEVKVGFSISEVLRQLFRYCESDMIGELVLITTRSSHLMPVQMDGKKLTTINIGLYSSL